VSPSGLLRPDVQGTERLKEGVEAAEVRCEIEEAFKGVVGKEIVIRVFSAVGTSCGPDGLTRSGRYLVQARTGWWSAPAA